MQKTEDGFLKISYVNGRKGSMSDFHSHDHLEMFYCLSDGISCLIGEDIYTVNRYDMVLFDRGTLHRTIIPEGVVYERYVLSFSQADLVRLAPEAAPLCRLFRSHRGHCVVSLRNDPQRDYFHERILKLCREEPAQYGELFRLSLLLELLIFLGGRESSAASPQQDSLTRQIQLVLQYLGEHFAEKLLLDDLCAHFYMSRSRLTRGSRAATGLTVGGISAGAPPGSCEQTAGGGDERRADRAPVRIRKLRALYPVLQRPLRRVAQAVRAEGRTGGGEAE